jgi:hypothetical protein
MIYDLPVPNISNSSLIIIQTIYAVHLSLAKLMVLSAINTNLRTLSLSSSITQLCRF